MQAMILCLVVAGLGLAAAQDLGTIRVIDGHNDLPYNLYKIAQNDIEKYDFETNLAEDPTWGASNCSTCHTDYERLREGGVAAQFWAAYVACGTQYKDAVAKTLEQIDVIHRLVAKYPGKLRAIKTAADLRSHLNNPAEERVGSLIGVEGGHSMDSRLALLRTYHTLGVRYMTLTHSCNTPWADNSYIEDKGPGFAHDLTDYGKLVVKEMNRIGMMIDLSHVSARVMHAVLDLSAAPVIFSHSSARALTEHNRNVPDDVLVRIPVNKGIVMVNFASVFVMAKDAANATLQDVVNHIDHIVDVMDGSVEFVGLGADYDGVDEVPEGLEDTSKYQALFAALQAHNNARWTKEALEKLAHGNLIRVFFDVENIASALPDKPLADWIEMTDLDEVDDVTLWRCRTLLDNTSPQRGGAVAAAPMGAFATLVAAVVARLARN